MSRPIRTTIAYDGDGQVASIDHRTVRVGTVDYGDGPEEVKKEMVGALARNLISAATVTALKKFVAAFETDVVAERKRVAAVRREEADRAAKAATEAAARAEVKP